MRRRTAAQPILQVGLTVLAAFGLGPGAEHVVVPTTGHVLRRPRRRSDRGGAAR